METNKHVLGLVLLASLARPVVAEVMDGATVYNRYCAACHDVGTATAPLTSDTEFWASRLEEIGSTSALTNAVLAGKGAMPAKGGCSSCNEDELRLAVEYMLPGNPTASASARDAVGAALAAIQLPPGFHIDLYARGRAWCPAIGAGG